MPTMSPCLNTSDTCTCNNICSNYPSSYLCGGYVVRDPWAVVIPCSDAPRSFFYESNGAKMQWTIDHNLGFKPNVTIWAKDANGKYTVPISADVQHTTDNSLIINFFAAVDGAANLS